MDDYISRKAALEYIKSVQCKTCSDIGLCGGCAVLVAVRLLEKVPAADLAEVVHGKWIGEGNVIENEKPIEFYFERDAKNGGDLSVHD